VNILVELAYQWRACHLCLLKALDNSAKNPYAIALFLTVIVDRSLSYHYRMNCCQSERTFEPYNS